MSRTSSTCYRTALRPRCIAILALLSCLWTSSASGQLALQAPTGLSGIQVDEVDGVAAAQLDRARLLLAQGQPEEAVATLRSIIESDDQRVVLLPNPSDSKYRRYIPLRVFATQILTRSPGHKAALQHYRELVDVTAIRQYEEAIAQHDRQGLLRVVDHFFASSVGDDALFALGILALEQGDFQHARAYWMQLAGPLHTQLADTNEWTPSNVALWNGWRSIPLDDIAQRVSQADLTGTGLTEQVYPDASFEVSQLLAHLALVSVLEGSHRRAAWEIELLRHIDPRAAGRLGGKQVVYVEELERLLEEDVVVTAPSEWLSFAGGSLRAGIAEPIVDLTLSPTWSRPLSNTESYDSATARHFGLPDLPVAERTNRILSRHAIVSKGTLYLSDGYRVFAFDVKTGDPAWGSNSSSQESAGVIYEGTRDPSVGDQATLPHLGIARHTLTLSEGMLFARMGAPWTIVPSRHQSIVEQGSIVGLDLHAEGRLLPGFPLLPDSPDGAFEGTPIYRDGCIYVAMRQGDTRPRLYVACYDLASYPRQADAVWHPLWRTLVCGSQSLGRGQVAEQTHGLLTQVGESLLINTNQGAVASLAINDGAIRWITSYPRDGVSRQEEPSSHLFRDLTPCLYHRGIVIVAPTDSDRIFALEATTGNLLWETDLPSGSLDAIHLLGISDRHLIASGRRLWWFDIATGRLSRDISANPFSAAVGQGRGILAGSTIVWPVHGDQDELLFLDAATGEPLRQPFPLAVAGAAAGNLTVAQRHLIITTHDHVYVFDSAIPKQ